ncbi:hypothetical protein ACQ86N_09990 [Puia sp. P3]|uniref:hypothetical protein n=1 Tax=Puia sp. P3 TaxID=3423952 RepID=UPI003D67D8DF
MAGDPAGPALTFESIDRKERCIDIFSRTSSPVGYTIRCDAPWVKIKEDRPAERVSIGIDWSKTPSANSSRATIYITGPDKKELSISVTANRHTFPPHIFIETGGCVSMEAEHFSRRIESSGIHWLTIPDLGRTLSGVEATPVTAPSITPGGNSPRLEYDVFLSDTGSVTVQAWFSPILQFNRKAIHYGVSIDDEQPQLVDMSRDNEARGNWDRMVADNIRIATSVHHVTRRGRHTLKFWFADPASVLQKLVIDAGGLKNSYLGPPNHPSGTNTFPFILRNHRSGLNSFPYIYKQNTLRPISADPFKTIAYPGNGVFVEIYLYLPAIKHFCLYGKIFLHPPGLSYLPLDRKSPAALHPQKYKGGL